MIIMIRYMKRREEVHSPANQAKPYLLSFIIDIMDQQKCGIPSKGTQGTFASPLKQIITGVKVHGEGIHLFPTFNTVHKGANLTIHIIDAVIEEWVRKHGYYPTKIYVQVDGGCENANQFVLHHLEHLVSKRIAREIWYTRLPTGHTHDDIDACFGIISKYFTSFNVIDTFAEFKKGIEKAFQDSDRADYLKCIVHDPIMIVADYKMFYQAFLDPDLEGVYNSIDTQHQWRFSCVERSLLFPRGVLVQYRAYSSPKVVVVFCYSHCWYDFPNNTVSNHVQVIELIKTVKAQCLTEMGQMIGLEPRTVFMEWQPSSKESSGNRMGIRGTYLLQGDPSGRLTPAALADSAAEEMGETHRLDRKSVV